MKAREYYFDTLKSVLIILVVLGHVLARCKGYWLNNGLYNFIFFFHMPLFIFVSGYFTHVDNKTKFTKGLIRIIETFICFQIIHIVIELLQGKPFTPHMLYIPRYTLWYLLCLVYWRLLVYACKNVFRKTNPNLIIAISFILGIAIGFVKLNAQLSFQRAFAFLPFFLCGYFAGKKELVRNISQQNATRIASMVIILLSVAILCVIKIPDGKMLYNSLSYFSFTKVSPIYACAFRIIYHIVACVISICVMALIPKKETTISKYGKDTLFIYMYHSLLLIPVFYVVNRLGWPKDTFFALAYCAIILIVLLFMKKIPIFDYLLNPITKKYFKSK